MNLTFFFTKEEGYWHTKRKSPFTNTPEEIYSII